MLSKLFRSKKIMSGLLAIILAVSTFSVIKADVLQQKQPLTVAIGNISGVQGEIVEVPVSINLPPTPIATYQMQVEFDKSLLEVTDIKPLYGSNASDCGDDDNGCFVSNIENNEGWFKTIWVDTSGGSHPITSAKTLFTIKLKLKTNVPLKNTSFKIDSAQRGNVLFSDDQGKEITPVEVTGGSIAVYVPDSPAGSTRTVPVVLEDGTQAANVEITRSTDNNGKKKDTVTLNEQKANETIGQALKSKQTSAVIVVSEPEKDKADFIQVNLNKEAISKLSQNNISIQIETEKASAVLPIDTLKQLDTIGNDLYFRMNTVTDSGSQKKTEELIKQAVPTAIPVSNPVDVETNFKGRTKVIVPLNQTVLPKDKNLLAEYLKTLSVHIQHSDGEIKIDKGEVIYGKDGTPKAVAVWVDKFSTFTVISSNSQKAAKEIGYIKVLKRINLWNRDAEGNIQFTRILNPGEMYKVYKVDQLHGGQFAVGGGAWITNMNSYVSYRSISEFGTKASSFPKGPKNEIGYVTITKPLNLWKRETNGQLTEVKVLKKGQTFRVYSTDSRHGGQYNLGGQYWITQMWNHITYESYK